LAAAWSGGSGLGPADTEFSPFFPQSCYVRVPTARAFAARTQTVILDLLIVIGLVAWPVGLDTVEYDFAAILRAHSVRLAAEWLRPHRNFFDCRPPNFAFLTR
jgi:hypothetical protein